MKSILRLLTAVFLLLASSAQAQYPELKEGDLVFQDLDCGPLCDAIEAVTEGYQNRDFSHVAIIIKHNKRLMALEAIGSKVHVIAIDSLMSRCPMKNKYLVMRLNKEYSHLIPMISKKAKSYIGLSYDDRFIMNNDSMYCSELVYELYQEPKSKEYLFPLQAMTYKQPGKNEYFPVWINYYKNLQSAIPEGLPGINPGLISRSPYLHIVE